MARIYQMPSRAPQFGFQQAGRDSAASREDPVVPQLDLFQPHHPNVVRLETHLGRFDEALMLHDREDPKAAGGLYAGDC